MELQNQVFTEISGFYNAQNKGATQFKMFTII